MERTSVPEVFKEMLRNMNGKLDSMWCLFKETREEMKKQSELFKNGMAEMKKQSELFENGMARLEMKLDTVLLKNNEEKVAMNPEDDSISNPVVGVHSTDVATEVIVQNGNSCTEADGIIEVDDVHEQSV